MSEHDRDVAKAIYDEIISPESVAEALRIWLNPGRPPWATDADDMRSVLAHVAQAAIDAVLARRQREIARTGPWEGESQHSAPIKDVGPGFAAFLRREMSCQASGCRWQWFAERQSEDGQGRDHYVWCQACGSAYPWRDTYYLRRLFEGEVARTGPWEGSMLAGTNPGDTPAKTGDAP